MFGSALAFELGLFGGFVDPLIDLPRPEKEAPLDGCQSIFEVHTTVHHVVDLAPRIALTVEPLMPVTQVLFSNSQVGELR